MVNEVLIRMREDEVLSVTDSNNDPQQKLVCKFVQDAVEFVMGSHTWNAQRKVWTVPLVEGKDRYTLPTSGQGAAIYTVRFSGTEELLDEANARYLSTKKGFAGKPSMYSTAWTDRDNLAVQLYPSPDARYKPSGDTSSSEYGIAEYAVAEYNGAGENAGSDELIIFGYSKAARLFTDVDDVALPHMPVMYYAMAYASRERGELGGQSTGELFQLAASYLSDAIAWDTNNSSLEYIWSSV
jgi:hypothetical protein